MFEIIVVIAVVLALAIATVLILGAQVRYAARDALDPRRSAGGNHLSMIFTNGAAGRLTSTRIPR